MGSFRIKDIINFSYTVFLCLDVFHGEYMQLFCTVFKWMYITCMEGFMCSPKAPFITIISSSKSGDFSCPFRYCCLHCGYEHLS